jgi:hypothetical protein
MDATSAVRDRAPLYGLAPLGAQFSRSVSVWLVALLGLGALLVCARRAAGALATPLPTAMLLPWMAFVGGCVLASRAAPRDALAERGVRFAARWGATTLLLVLWAVGLGLPQTSPGGLVGIWGIVLAVEAVSWARRWANSNRRALPHDRVARLDALPSSNVHGPGTFAVVDAESPEQISQHVVRKRDDDGEVIEGWLRVDFAARQRHATAHLAICPPLGHTPRCYAEPSSGPDAELKVAQVLPYGVRFEVKLDAVPSDATNVVIDFAIREQLED